MRLLLRFQPSEHSPEGAGIQLLLDARFYRIGRARPCKQESTKRVPWKDGPQRMCPAFVVPEPLPTADASQLAPARVASAMMPRPHRSKFLGPLLLLFCVVWIGVRRRRLCVSLCSCTQSEASSPMIFGSCLLLRPRAVEASTLKRSELWAGPVPCFIAGRAFCIGFPFIAPSPRSIRRKGLELPRPLRRHNVERDWFPVRSLFGGGSSVGSVCLTRPRGPRRLHLSTRCRLSRHYAGTSSRP